MALGTLATAGLIAGGIGAGKWLGRELGFGSKVPGVTGDERKRNKTHQEATDRARKLQSLYRRQGALDLQSTATQGMLGFDPSRTGTGGASLAFTRRLGKMGNLAHVKGEAKGMVDAERVDPDRKREALRQRMVAAAAAAAAAGQTKEQMFQTISSMAAGDPVLMKEARKMAASQGRLTQAGTIPGYVEDIGSLVGIGSSTT